MQKTDYYGRSFSECDWCGAEIDGAVHRDRIGGEFCSKAHRDASTRAVRALRSRCDPELP